MIEFCQVFKPDSRDFLLYVQFDDKITEFPLFDKICRPYTIIASDVNSVTISLNEMKK